METTPSVVIMVLGVVFSLAAVLKKIRDAQEGISEWILCSKIFRIWAEARDAKVEKESETTRSLIIEKMDEIKAAMVPKEDFVRLQEQVRSMKTIDKLLHNIPGESSTYHPGDPLP